MIVKMWKIARRIYWVVEPRGAIMTLYQMIEKYYDPYFKALGYHKTGVCEFSRLNDSKNIQKVEIQKDKYSKKYRISLSVWPTYLYDQCELGFLAIMNLDCLVNGVRKGEQWKSYENEGVANESFQKAAQEFEKYSQTWFDKYNIPTQFIDKRRPLLYQVSKITPTRLVWIVFYLLMEADVERAIDFLHGISRYHWILNKKWKKQVLNKKTELKKICDHYQKDPLQFLEHQEASVLQLDAVMNLFQKAKENMAIIGINQWDEYYPTASHIKEDYEQKELKVVRYFGEIVAAYVVNNQADEEYENGDWKGSGENFQVIHRLCVNPDYQNRGIAKRVIQKIEDTLKQTGVGWLRLDVFSKNPYALHLYERLGYKVVGEANWRKGLFYLL